jgi:hypothetical protein
MEIILGNKIEKYNPQPKIKTTTDISNIELIFLKRLATFS